MPCLNCGNPATCRAHILPGAVGKDIINSADDGRKALSLAAPDRIDDTLQSGIFDSDILCSACDGKLGLYDDHAIDISRLVGTRAEVLTRNDFTIQRHNGVNHEHLALFAAAVLWRASVSSYRELSQFSLDAAEQERFRAMALKEIFDVPTVAVLRLVSDNPIAHKAARLAMSYPGRFITGDGHWRVKFSIRGLLFLTKIGQRPDAWLEAIAVTTLGKAKGPAYLTGALFSFDGLLEADNVRSTKYVTSILGPVQQLP
jgi:hypothetical protein